MQPKNKSRLVDLSDDDLDKLAILTHNKSFKDFSIVATPEQTKNYIEILKDTKKVAGVLRKQTRPIEFSFIDLFAGIGGFRLAGENSSGTCTFSCEKDKYARISYYYNFGKIPFGDINTITHESQISKIPDHDVLCGGFPCQAFSISGKRLGFADSRGILFYRIIDILENKIEHEKPVKIVFLENVKNLKKHGETEGQTLQIINNEFRTIGYTLSTIVLNSGFHGAATKRERIYLIAVHDESFPDLEKIHKFNTALEKLKKLKPKGESVSMNLESLTKDEIIKYSIPENRIMTNVSILNDLDKIAKKTLPLKPIQIGKIGKKGDPRKGRQGERIYSIYGQATTFSANGGGLAAKTGAYLIDGIVRKLTPTECAKIMGFKRGEKIMKTNELTKIGVSQSQLYKQFGNSVVVPTVQIIFKLIQKHFFP